MDKFEHRRMILRALVDSLGRGGINRVAQKINKEASYVSRMLYPHEKKGAKRIGEETAELLAVAYPDFFGIDVPPAHPPPEPEDPADTPVGAPVYSAGGPSIGYTRLPVMAEAAAGHGRVPEMEVVQHIDVLESYVRQRLGANPKNIRVLTARGSSMTGIIEDGDVMFVQPTCEFTDDGIYILTLDDLVRVKRLSVSMSTGRVVIESNDGRAAEELPLKEVPHRLHIQGRVLGSWSLRKFA